VPICTNHRGWGLLAVISRPDNTSALQTYRHWANQLCASFEAEELQDAVRESEERYAFAAQASNDGLWESNLKTAEFYLSGRCMEMLGIESRAGQDRLALWMSRVHPDDVEEVKSFNERVSVGTQKTATCEYRVRVDGSYRWVLVRALAVRSASGAVERVVGSLSDVHERRCLEDQLRQNALYDSLTGLPNRRLFLSRLEHAVATWKRIQTPFAVIFLDLDGFKAINDSLGHHMGDRVLTAIGSRIKAELREVDTGARFGGDEFAILAHADHDEAFTLARRVQSALARIIQLDNHEFTIGASIGVATSEIGYTCAEDVLRDADTAMYRAKENDRGTVAFFDSAMGARALQDLRLSGELHQALEEHQFEMHYQPIVNLVTGRADRFEALVRWRHPTRGLMTAEEFLPAMEESGAIVQLGHWIIDEVCRQLAVWGLGAANVVVTVSDREFWQGDVLAHVVSALTQHQLSANRLTLEIAEGVIMRRPDVAALMMRALRDAGLQLHIDGSRTGHSSLETLHRLPVAAFKIDRSVIAQLTTGDRTEELLRAIVAMGHALDLDVVVEGVENRGQMLYLQEIGCAAAQGNLFMGAVSGEQAMATLGSVLAPWAALETAAAGSRL
jgi:diguanylate cyclase (GGDEF)-like protein/PAS domain S-box-containing protein